MTYVSLKDIASRAGVSIAAVSMALRNQPRISAKLKLKIQAIADEMGYRPPTILHEAMSQLRNRRPSHFFGRLVLCSDLTQVEWKYRWTAMFNVLKDSAWALGYDLELLHLSDFNRPQPLRATLRSRNVRGIFLVPSARLRPGMEFLLEEYACVVLGHAPSRGIRNHFVTPDFFQIGRRGAREMLDRGYRRIGFAGSEVVDPPGLCEAGVYSMRSLAHFSTLRLHAIPLPSLKVFTSWLHTEKIDGILTMGNEVRNWLKEADLRIPEDIGLIHLYRTPLEDKIATGVDPLLDEVNKAGLNRLVAMLRQGESGIPAVQECIMVEGMWMDGSTARPTRNLLLHEAEPPVLTSCENGSPNLRCLDLEPYVNRPLTRFGGWFGSHSLNYCTPGEHRICGTRFQILDEKTKGNAALIMASKKCPGYDVPNPTQVEIPIHRRIRAVHFLHACGWSEGSARNFASYQFVDGNGRSKVLPLIDRRALSGPESAGNIQDYWPLLPPLTGPHVRPIHLTAYGNSEIYSAYLYVLEWINPTPRKMVKALRIISDPSTTTTLGVLAITLQV